MSALDVLKRVSADLVQLPAYLLSFCVPRRKDIWLFGAWYGRAFSDNPKYLYLSLIQHTHLKKVWITKERRLRDQLRAEGITAYSHLEPAGIYYQLRAGVVCSTHLTCNDFLGAAVYRCLCRVQLWHGSPLKKIMLDDEIQRNQLIGEGLPKRVYKAIFRWRREKYTFVIAASDEVKTKIETSFKGLTERVLVTGYPRTDALRASAQPGRKGPVRCIYMPTFRGQAFSRETFLESTGFDPVAVDARLRRMGAELHLRLHPANTLSPSIADAIKRCTAISISQEDDIYAALSGYDVLITDYSSIMFDYMMTRRPIIFAPLDIGSYTQSDRSLYYSYSCLNLTPDCTCWDAILDRIESYPNVYSQAEKAAYRSIVEKFNSYFDGCSSQRVAQAILESTTSA